MSKKYQVYYWIKGQPKQVDSFDSFPAAQAFLKAMNQNPQCEACGHVWNSSRGDI